MNNNNKKSDADVVVPVVCVVMHTCCCVSTNLESETYGVISYDRSDWRSLMA